MNLKPYTKYKYSGIEWIGETPNDWEIRKLGSISSITRLAGFEYNDYWEDDPNGEITALRGYNIANGYLNLKNTDKISTDLSKFLSRSKLYKGDIVFPCTGTIGNAAIIDENDKYHINQNIAKITIKENIYEKYILYFLLSDLVKYQIKSYNSSGLQPVILVGNLRRFIILIPPLKEQKKIAEFLNKRTSEIDITIKKDIQLIELFKEKKAALINHVVTNGLDPYIKMKDSGVEWIGEIPEHWNISQIKRYFNVTKLAGFEFSKYIKYVPNGEIIAIRALNLQDGNLIFNYSNTMKISKEISDKLPRSKLDKGDLILTYIGANVGSVATVPENNKYHLAPNVSKLVNKKPDEFITDFLRYYLISNSGKNELNYYVSKTSQEVISMAKIRSIRFIVPPINEQEQIVEYINKKTSKIDYIIKMIEKKIKLMREYKKSLIHHVVTGKVDVRGVNY